MLEDSSDPAMVGLSHETAAEAAAPSIPSLLGQDPAARNSLAVILILSVLMAFGSLSVDVYLPALPAIGRMLGADAGTMALTLSGYLVGFSLGQLLWGPISDKHGRRAPVAAGLVLFVIGSAGCALAMSAWVMIGWRVLQATGACAGVVLARAMVRDLYERDRAAKMLSTLILIMSISPLIGPLIGGQVLSLSSWRAIFWLLVVIGVATLVALFALPETLPPAARNPKPLGRALAGYGELLRHRRLLGYAGSGGFFYIGIFAYIGGTPFAYITFYHVRPQLYGLLFGFTISGIIAANLINSRLVTKLGSDRLLRAGTVIAALSGIVVATVAWTGWGGLAGLVVTLFAFTAMSGLIMANSIAGALASFPDRAGAASALVGAIHFGTGMVGSALVGSFADGTPWPLGWVIGVSGIGSLLCAHLLVPHKAAAC